MANDKMVTQYGESVDPPCMTCVWRSKEEVGFCLAFPKGNIPKDILLAKNSHTKPVKGDHGYQYLKGEPSQ